MTSFPDFGVASGEEASDPLVAHDGRIVRVDQLAASDHLARIDDDLAAVAGLGVRWWRCGMPWRLVEPEPGVYDWTLWDQALAACERHGLEPVVDLCHFGLPDHLGGFCEGAWVEAFGRYVDAFLARYAEPRFFTPVNEPSITAQCSGRRGIARITSEAMRGGGAMVPSMTATAACSHRGFVIPAFERRTDWRSLLLGAPPTRT